MNKIETTAFNWLIEAAGYKPSQIKFQPNASPDFICIDGSNYEVKKLGAKNRIIFTKTQFDLLRNLPSCKILVFASNEDSPFAVFDSQNTTELPIQVGAKKITVVVYGRDEIIIAITVPSILMAEFEEAISPSYGNRGEAIREGMRLLIEKIRKKGGVVNGT